MIRNLSFYYPEKSRSFDVFPSSLLKMVKLSADDLKWVIMRETVLFYNFIMRNKRKLFTANLLEYCI